jgi:hypothetical protein
VQLDLIEVPEVVERDGVLGRVGDGLSIERARERRLTLLLSRIAGSNERVDGGARDLWRSLRGGAPAPGSDECTQADGARGEASPGS